MGFFGGAQTKVVIRCPALLLALELPVWPDDDSNTLPAWNRTSLERPGRRAVDVPSTRTTEERSLGFTLRNEDYRQSVAPMLETLRKMSNSQYPVQLLMGQTGTGLWSMDAPQVTNVNYAADGTPSVVDVSVVLKRASDAVVKVGPVKRVKGRGKNLSKRR